jgi:drug/metabolite transporter (DMT)-like permease
MTLFAFGLVLASAFLHAFWNLLAKRASGGTSFVWLISVFSALIYFPLTAGLILSQQPYLSWVESGFMMLTGILHVAYYLLLDRGYRAGDMSLVYPLSRGTGPILSIGGAVLLLGERPGVGAIIGAVLVTVGVFLLTGNPLYLRQSQDYRPVVYGLLTGVIISAYTLSDKVIVSRLLVPPLVLIWFSSAARTILLYPAVRRQWLSVRETWARHRMAVLGVAILDTLSYVLFLLALQVGQVSYLAPARQISILFGAILGARLLAEGKLWSRAFASSVMLVGLLALALG